LTDQPVAHLRAHLDEVAAWPLPASGRTGDRWAALADVARRDLSRARVVEGHADALAILAELGATAAVPAGATLGVWAAEPGRLRATPLGRAGWRLDGAKGWCSGSTELDRALVVATAPDGPRLFVVDPSVDGVTVEPGSWRPLGMAATRSETLLFDGVAVRSEAAIGGPDAYVRRAGFGHGGCGVAACWFGGAAGLLDDLWERADRSAPDQVAALGAARSELDAAAAVLAVAAREVDGPAPAARAEPEGAEPAWERARRVRLAVERACRRVLEGAVVALGAGALCHDPAVSGRVADLTVYLRQLRPGPDLAAVGLGSPPPRRWW
jgi:alkylation response protein AidB-like acyl-CoA dehydrogenase